MSRPASIPWTAMATRYKALEKQHAPRLRQVACDLADPEPLIADLAASAAAFASYANVDERFYSSGRRPLPELVPDLGNGRAVMAKLRQAGTCRVDANRAYSYVDYELVPTRTTPGTITFDNGKTWRSALRLDLLLAGNEASPVAAEIKAGADKDPYFALVQALAHAVHLGTPRQLERLRKCYPKRFSGERVDVAVILSDRPEVGNYLELLLHGAQLLGEALLQDERVADHIGSIDFVEAKLRTDGQLSLSRIPAPTRRPASEAPAPLGKLKKTIQSWEGDIVRRFGADHPLLTTTAPRDIWWFKGAAAALYVGG